MTIYRVSVPQVLIYEVEAPDENALWDTIESDDFGDPADAVDHYHPEITRATITERPSSTIQ